MTLLVALGMSDALLRYVRHMQLHAEEICAMRLEKLNRAQLQDMPKAAIAEILYRQGFEEALQLLETMIEEAAKPPSGAEA